MGIVESINQLLKLLLPPMSTMPSHLNEVTNTPFFENPELFQEDSDVEEDPEKIQQEADEHIVSVKIHNERRQLEWEDQKQTEEEEQRMKEEEEEQK